MRNFHAKRHAHNLLTSSRGWRHQSRPRHHARHPQRRGRRIADRAAFTALFPQFLNAHEPLLPQFLILTGIFMAMSLVSLLTYGALARRARGLLRQPRIVVWLNRVVGSIFVAFGLALLRLKRVAA
ncbi:LysE family translocator [Achromobacter sp. NPDC058515]|uniref:LysE family translocator n=1 Tax=Achromobacter sp. NPDC058515 TaxID=3346533 RepID=UPI00364990DB